MTFRIQHVVALLLTSGGIPLIRETGCGAGFEPASTAFLDTILGPAQGGLPYLCRMSRISPRSSVVSRGPGQLLRTGIGLWACVPCEGGTAYPFGIQ